MDAPGKSGGRTSRTRFSMRAAAETVETNDVMGNNPALDATVWPYPNAGSTQEPIRLHLRRQHERLQVVRQESGGGSGGGASGSTPGTTAGPSHFFSSTASSTVSHTASSTVSKIVINTPSHTPSHTPITALTPSPGSTSRIGAGRGNSLRVARPPPIHLPTLTDDEVYFPLSPPPPPTANAVSVAEARNLFDGPPDRHSFASSGLLPDMSVYNQQQYHHFSPRAGQIPQPDASQKPSGHASHRIVHEAASGGPPSIYWSDDGTNVETDTIRSVGTVGTMGASANPSAFTFLRGPTPPPGRRFSSGEDDDDDDDENRDGERGLSAWAQRHSQEARDARTAEKHSEAALSGFGGVADARRTLETPLPALHSGRRASANTLDSATKEERRTTADFEFVNGRYVPPGLREGRMPGRIPPGAAALGIEKYGGLSPGGSRSAAGTPGRYTGLSEDGGSSYYNRERRYRYWLIVGLLTVFIIAVSVGVGVGVGLSVK